MAVSREKFLELDGFDALYLPGRFEDLDLAFRGWLAGWKAYYVPEAVAYHKGSATFGPRLSRRTGRELDVRNSLLFAWKNLRDPRHVTLHAVFLAARLARALAMGHGTFLRGWASAVRQLPEVLRRRRSTTTRLRSERELFEMLCVEQLNR